MAFLNIFSFSTHDGKQPANLDKEKTMHRGFFHVSSLVTFQIFRTHSSFGLHKFLICDKTDNRRYRVSIVCYLHFVSAIVPFLHNIRITIVICSVFFEEIQIVPQSIENSVHIKLKIGKSSIIYKLVRSTSTLIFFS